MCHILDVLELCVSKIFALVASSGQSKYCANPTPGFTLKLSEEFFFLEFETLSVSLNNRMKSLTILG